LPEHRCSTAVRAPAADSIKSDQPIDLDCVLHCILDRRLQVLLTDSVPMGDAYRATVPADVLANELQRYGIERARCFDMCINGHFARAALEESDVLRRAGLKDG
jgi:hypothetical protein